MRPDEFDAYEAAARDLIDGLGRLAEDVQAPPEFLATVLAKADQLPPPRKRLRDRLRDGFECWRSWRAPLSLGVAHSGLALGVVALRRSWRVPLSPEVAVVAVVILALIGAIPQYTTWFNVYVRSLPADQPVVGMGGITLNSARFQAAITSETDLATLARQHPALGGEIVAFGFAPKPTAAKFFSIGALYAEAVAYTHHGDRDDAAQRLAAIEREYKELPAPIWLSTYLRLMRHMTEHQPYADADLMEFLTLLQPLLDEYARSQGEEPLALFRLGTWSVDMGLAAAAKDTAMLRQPTTVRYFSQALKRVNAPPGVLKALDEMARITAQPTLTDADATAVLTLVQRIQAILA